MLLSSGSLLLGLGLISAVSAADYSDLVGTWTTKSKKVLTGPGFFDPVSDKLIEPSLTGISYSFTSDGYYEEAYYRAIANPTDPSCPQGIMQWQHGTFTKNDEGNLTLTPLAVDGRQLLSEPCTYEAALYTRYDQKEIFQRYSVYTDPYHNVQRLDLYEFDGSQMQPMYLQYSPPQMLPTTTLLPTATASTTTTASSKFKRDIGDAGEEKPMSNLPDIKPAQSFHYDADMVWWTGVAFTVFGGMVYMYT